MKSTSTLNINSLFQTTNKLTLVGTVFAFGEQLSNAEYFL